MQIFWDITPRADLSKAPAMAAAAESVADSSLSPQTSPHVTYLLTQPMDESQFPSAATRESILRWASEENGVGRYIGRVRVIDLRAIPHLIRAQHLNCHLFGNTSRIMLRTKSDLRDTPPILTVEAVKLMASCGVKLIGIDADSLDAPNSPSQEVFKAAQQCGLSIMLNLHLEDTSAGDYELIALPAGGSKAASWKDLEIAYAKSSTTRAA